MSGGVEDVFCSCTGGRKLHGRRASCGEALCKAKPLPEVQLCVSGSVARASGVWFSLAWRIYAEFETNDRARVSVRCSPRPGSNAAHVADVTVHREFGANLVDEVQSIAAALLWSRLRCGWLERD